MGKSSCRGLNGSIIQPQAETQFPLFAVHAICRQLGGDVLNTLDLRISWKKQNKTQK